MKDPIPPSPEVGRFSTRQELAEAHRALSARISALNAEMWKKTVATLPDHLVQAPPYSQLFKNAEDIRRISLNELMHRLGECGVELRLEAALTREQKKIINEDRIGSKSNWTPQNVLYRLDSDYPAGALLKIRSEYNEWSPVAAGYRRDFEVLIEAQLRPLVKRIEDAKITHQQLFDAFTTGSPSLEELIAPSRF